MTYSIVYSSKTGNTKMLADALHQALPADDCLYFGAPDAQALAAERIYIGFWTDKGTCDAETAAFLAQLKIIKRWGGAAQADLAAASRILSRSSRVCAISCRKACSSSAAISAQAKCPRAFAIATCASQKKSPPSAATCRR